MMSKERSSWITLNAGELRLTLEQTDEGVALLSLFDSISETEFLSKQLLPLFTIKLRHIKTKEELNLSADYDWSNPKIEHKQNNIFITWEEHKSVKSIKVTAKAELNDEDSSISWELDVKNNNQEWSIMNVSFPQIGISELSSDACVFFPRGPGEVQKGLWQIPFRHSGLYPEPWTVMQFVSVYDDKKGLYIATHDPNASAKEITIESRPDENSVVFMYSHPAEDMGIAGNDFSLSGKAIWKLFRGDWFDSALIYRRWVCEEARWFPDICPDGRDDTPSWMRELCVWVTTSGNSSQVVPRVKEFAKYIGVPVGFHWYNWHQIPFDNDYPHYFPPTEGFADGVKELLDAGVFVMPYINGRLWDTRDKGTEDFEFSSIAFPAVTKDENGEPFIEMYGSRESDGSPVKFAVMCPVTELWQKRVRDICLRLFNEYKVSAVYIDQVAAMFPRLCMDKEHGHPLGGGHWWVEGYWKMLQSIRDSMPGDRMLTTECNSEPYIRWFDGYLTWTWQYDGQVPAFPAVYASAIQMFGRAYRDGDLAFRMKAGQQLVFGEQIGWIDPNIINEKNNAEFLRQVVKLRWILRRYFYAGEMCRPPKLSCDIPKVRADWKWSGEWWVTTDGLLTGAWRLPQDNKLALIFVNVSDEDISANIEFKAKEYDVIVDRIKVSVITQDGVSDVFESASDFQKQITLPKYNALAWEIEITD